MRRFVGQCLPNEGNTIVLTACTELQSHVHFDGGTVALFTEEPGITAEKLMERLRLSFGITLALTETPLKTE